MTAALVLALALAQERSLEESVGAVLPAAGEERWIAIPWRMNVTQARAEAQESGKPLFLWVMDGNVLGCT